MDQVRPQDGQWHSDHAYLDWPAYPLPDTHQVAAMRRPRTEARAGDGMTQEGFRLPARTCNGWELYPERVKNLSAVLCELDHYLLVQPDIHGSRVFHIAGVVQFLCQLFAS